MDWGWPVILADRHFPAWVVPGELDLDALDQEIEVGDGMRAGAFPLFLEARELRPDVGVLLQRVRTAPSMFDRSATRARPRAALWSIRPGCTPRRSSALVTTSRSGQGDDELIVVKSLDPAICDAHAFPPAVGPGQTFCSGPSQPSDMRRRAFGRLIHQKRANISLTLVRAACLESAVIGTLDEQACAALRLAEANPARSAVLARAIADQARQARDLAPLSIAERALGLAAFQLEDPDAALRHLHAAVRRAAARVQPNW